MGFRITTLGPKIKINNGETKTTFSLALIMVLLGYHKMILWSERQNLYVDKSGQTEVETKLPTLICQAEAPSVLCVDVRRTRWACLASDLGLPSSVPCVFYRQSTGGRHQRG